MSRQPTNKKNVFAVRIGELYSEHGVGPIPFEDVLDQLRPQTDDELVEVIKADAAEMIVRNQPVTVFRYGPFVEGRPGAHDAAVEACAGSHYELDEMSWEEAQRAAHNEAALRGRGTARRPLPKKRRRLVGNVVTVPVPVVTIIVVVAVLAMGWMGQSLYAANLRYERAEADVREAEAQADAEYERGEREALKRLQEKQAELLEQEHQLRRLQEKSNNELAESVKVGVWAVEDEMAAGRVRNAVEIAVGIEQLVIRVQESLPNLPGRYSTSRVDSLLMPLLGLVYEHVNLEAREEALPEIRKQLQKLEEAWFVDIRPDDAEEHN